MRSKLQVDVLLRGVREAVAAASAGTLGDLEQHAIAALGDVSLALGADRACLCFVGASAPRPSVERFVSGGRADLRPLGDALLGLPVAEVPEWSRPPAPGHETVPADLLSRPLAAAASAVGCDWMCSMPLAIGGITLATLSIVGRGTAPEADPERSDAIDTVAQLLTIVARRAGDLRAAAPTSTQSRLAIDLIDEGVMFLDAHGLPLSCNRAAQHQLGCGADGLDRTRPIWEQFDLRLSDGTPVKSAADSSDWFDRMGVFGPTSIRLVSRQGLVVTGRLTVRAIETDEHHGGAAMVALFAPSPGVGAPSGTPAIEAVLRRADELFDELQRAITSGSRPAEAALPAALSDIGLSTRERDVVVLLLEGHRVSTIAQRLYLSPHTVRNHLKAIFRKAKVGSQAALIDLARTPVPDGAA